MPGPVVRTILHDIRCNRPHLQVAEALRSYSTAQAMALERGLPKEVADDVARRSIAAARADFDIPARARGLPSWLYFMIAPTVDSEGFASRLMTRQSREFVDWLIAHSARDGVLDQGRVDAADLEPWRRHLTIIRQEPDAEEFRYRVYGAEACRILGRDLTGRTLAVWPPKIARVKRGRLHTLVARRVPVLVHSVALRYEDGARRRGSQILEQLLWPMRCGVGAPDAVLDFSTLVPDSHLTADGLRMESSRLARDFAADGAPVAYAPRVAC